MSTNSFNTKQSLSIDVGRDVTIFSLKKLEESGYPDVGRLPYCLLYTSDAADE